ncbi:AAA family ATPase [Marivirga tractuosa]|uniref:AAA family ATPase n=1 Tax=Marivirga tractuosa TaxID=1006 RepID=UPI0035CF0223
MDFKRFSITKLFGEKDFDIVIENNVILLVAENGSGKTTLLRIIYYFLSKQWIRLLDFNFESIVANVEGKKIQFNRDEFLTKRFDDIPVDDLIKKYPVYKSFLESDLKKIDVLDLIRNPIRARQLESDYDIPLNLLIKLIDDITQKMFSSLNANWNENIIYLPTFRRIEREFSDLFNDLDKRLELRLKSTLPKYIYTNTNELDSLDEFNDKASLGRELSQMFTNLWSSRDLENWKRKEAENFHMELVEFGMSDVKYHVRNYIAQNVDKSTKKIDGNDKLKTFLRFCNEYLISDKLVIEGRNLTVKSKSGEVLDLINLSSGEKQIISIFAHLCLNQKPPIIIIDEPELSLSIKWQETLISDIMKAGARFLISATHSPFIVSDEYMSMTHGLNEFNK